MKTTTDKRLTFDNDTIKQIHIAAAYVGVSAKAFMQTSVIAATIQTIAEHKKK